MKVVRLGDRVPRSGTRIVYDDRVSRFDTRIEYGLGATFRYQDRIWIGCHVLTPG